LEKLQLKMIGKPNPNTSMPSIPKDIWTVSLPNDTGEYNQIIESIFKILN
jgi:hypothetical protein